MPVNKSRIPWVDIVKGIGIFLVVLGHVYRNNAVLIWLYSFHMPLFFMLSGWLHTAKRKSLSMIDYCIKKFQLLIIPMIIFLSISYIYWLLVERHFRDFDIGPMWFLIILFLVDVFFEAMIIKLKRYVWLLLPVLLIGFFFGTIFLKSTCIFIWLSRLLGGCFFFFVGGVFSLVVELKTFTIKKRMLIASIILLILSGILSYLNGRVDMYSLIIGRSFLLLIANAFIGSSAVVCFSVFLSKCKLFQYMGRHSIIILCTHEPIKRLIIKVLSVLIGRETEAIRNDILFGFFIAVIVVAFEFLVIETIKQISRTCSKTKFAWLVAFVK